MKNFETSEFIRLEEKYLDSSRYFCLNVLRHLESVALKNNNTLPNDFEMQIYLPDLEFIKEVLKDLGYPHVRNIRRCGQKIFVTLI